MTAQSKILCKQDCEIIGIVLAASVVLGALMAAVGSVAAEYIIPGMNASQGAILVGFAGALTCPFIFITAATVIKIVDSMYTKHEKSSSFSDFTVIVAACFMILGTFAAATIIASFIPTELGLKDISFIEAIKLSGCSLGLVIGVALSVKLALALPYKRK